MSVESPRKAEVIAAQSRFFVGVGGCIAVIVLVHCLPKMQAPASLRLFYTVVYFAAVLMLLSQLMDPLKSYLRLLFAWRYETAPDAMQRQWKSLAYSLHQLVSTPAWIIFTFVASVALITLAEWFPDLQFVTPILNLAWWCSLVAFVLFPVTGGFLFNEVIQKYRMLSQEKDAIRGFEPRAYGDLQTAEVDDSPQPFQSLDRGRFHAGGVDWDFGDFVQNCVVFGQTGSGKTSCVLNSLLEGLFKCWTDSSLQPAGLILDVKGTMLPDLRNLCLKNNRVNDLLVIDPDDPNSARWNPFDAPEDDEYELAARFAAVGKSLGQRNPDPFWPTASTEFMQHALKLIRVTNGPDTPPSFEQIYELVVSFSAIDDRAKLVPANDHSADRALRYFAKQWGVMAAETRSGIQGHLAGMLFPFLNEPFDTHFGGRSTIRTAEMIDSGKIVYLKMPAAGREQMARFIGIFLKLEYYRQVLLRPDKKRPSFFFCDEFQKFFTAGTKDDPDQEKSDADTFRLSRQSYHANIVATQNIRAFGEAEVAEAFLGNCLTGIFLRNPDDRTNEYSSKLFGEEIMAMGGAQPGMGRGGLLRGIGGQGVGGHDQRQRRCPPDKFRELSTCERAQDKPHAEAIVFLGSKNESPIPIRRLKWRRHPLSLS